MIRNKVKQTLLMIRPTHRPIILRRIMSQSYFQKKNIQHKINSYKVPQSENINYEEKLLLPFIHNWNNHFVKLTADIMRAWNYWLQVDEETFRDIQDIVLIITNGCLIVDDIEDNCPYRDGVPTSHSLYGVGNTINAANYAMTNAIEKSIRLGNTQAVNILIDRLLEVYQGQGVEMYWRDNYICPTETEFIENVQKKCGFLFLMIIQLMQLFSKNESDFTNFISSFSLYLQILDDYMDIQPEKGINSVDDITDGKFSLPIIHAIKTLGDARILPILRLRTQDIELKRHCISILESGGSLQYTRNMLQALDQQIRNEMVIFGHNPCMLKIMEEHLIYT